MEKEAQLFSVPLGHAPSRVLCDDTDLFTYPDLQALKTFTLEGGIPGPAHGFAYDAAAHTLYVRLHAGTAFGPPDPNTRTMKVSPPGSSRNIATPALANWSVLADGPAYVELDGFTFETPGLAGVFAKAPLYVGGLRLANNSGSIVGRPT